LQNCGDKSRKFNGRQPGSIVAYRCADQFRCSGGSTFRKAGIVRCYGREELTTVACVFMCKELVGRKLAIITHAGGPGVMLTDALEAGGLENSANTGFTCQSLL
jgi:acyl-CoA synthetase (NDP forming)